MKRLLIIMLILVAIGIASADIIHFNTDLIFGPDDITLEGYDNNDWLGTYSPFPINYDSNTKNLTVYDNWTYRVQVNGILPIDFGSGKIKESGIDMSYTDYYIIEKYFLRVPGDPGTPITQ